MAAPGGMTTIPFCEMTGLLKKTGPERLLWVGSGLAAFGDANCEPDIR